MLYTFLYYLNLNFFLLLHNKIPKRITGLKMLVFRKILRTYFMDGPHVFFSEMINPFVPNAPFLYLPDWLSTTSFYTVQVGVSLRMHYIEKPEQLMKNMFSLAPLQSFFRQYEISLLFKKQRWKKRNQVEWLPFTASKIRKSKLLFKFEWIWNGGRWFFQCTYITSILNIISRKSEMISFFVS